MMPIVMTMWVAIFVHPYSLGVAGWASDFPLSFWIGDIGTQRGRDYGWSIGGVWGFLVDTSLALAAAYLIAMAVDRLLFPWVRARQGMDRAPDDSN